MEHQEGRATTHPSKKGCWKVLEIAFERVPRRVLRRGLTEGFRGRKGSEKGSSETKGFMGCSPLIRAWNIVGAPVILVLFTCQNHTIVVRNTMLWVSRSGV